MKLDKNGKRRLNSLEDFFETMYFGQDGLKTAQTAAERVYVLFQTAREYRELLCHENELLNKRKTLFWSTQAALCTAYYYIFLCNENITHVVVWFGAIALQIFLCVWGIISTVRFLRGLYYGARANRFLLFRWQAFIELYVSCVLAKDSEGTSEKTRTCVDIPVSVTPFFPPVIGLADPREGLRADNEEADLNEEVLLNCNGKNCVEILEQIAANGGKKVGGENSWYFDCKPGRLVNWYKAKMHKCYDVLLIGWWAALYLYAVGLASHRIASFERGMAILAAVALFGSVCFMVKLFCFCLKNRFNFNLKKRARELGGRFCAWLKNEPYRPTRQGKKSAITKRADLPSRGARRRKDGRRAEKSVLDAKPPRS
ncbi:MAG: hypothetical protein IKK39_12410 [Thermoguttaceae bacterium]|nr:hypothetical protein [Thermoguttaceae bacterium]